MTKNYLKPTRLFGLILTLSSLICFYSCDKHGKLEGSIWESDYFEIKYQDPVLPPPGCLHEEMVLRGKITISFAKDNASVFIKELELFDKINDTGYYQLDPRHQSVDYTCKRKDLTLFFDTEGYFAGQNWVGTVDDATMSLRIVSGETVKFKKQ
ncbi:hypothetical protein LJC68_10435 [Bacteroidales bacterium OttesenSCG-928-B11]|nr:hypothetical protein [Bacteroidales bacterium OttesenSCG-928-B11]